MIMLQRCLILASIYTTTSLNGSESEFKTKSVNGFLKQTAKNTYNTTYYKCWTSNTTYTTEYSNLYTEVYSSLCDNDPKFYQACGKLKIYDIYLHLNEFYLCAYYICKEDLFMDLNESRYAAGKSEMERVNCNKNQICQNDNVNMNHCDDNSGKEKCFGGGRFLETQKCDGKKDCLYRDDEVGCNHTYGIECTPDNYDPSTLKIPKTIWVPPSGLCDDVQECKNGTDLKKNEETCGEDKKVGECSAKTVQNVTERRSFYQAQCCSPIEILEHNKVCLDGQDQINCTNSEIIYDCIQANTSHVITLTDKALCSEIQYPYNMSLCADNFHNVCETPEEFCRIHRHLICDGKDDCHNGIDEVDCDNKATNTTCVRRVHNSTEPKLLPILKDWVMDNISDCINEIDEDEKYWTKCEYEGRSTPIWIDSKVSCKSFFKCSNGNFTEPQDMCDGKSKESCPLESELCNVARKKNGLKTKTKSNQSNIKYLSTSCINSTDNICKHYILEESYGTTPILIFVNKSDNFNCTELYGEEYVYAACLRLCEEKDTLCPLKTSIDSVTSCPNLPDRTLTLTKNHTLTFVKTVEITKLYIDNEVKTVENTKSYINNEVFLCDNGNCLSYDKVCNLIDDCGDRSDEINCSNHFKCDSNSSTTEIIELTRVCDGVSDCANYQDECNTKCADAQRELIPSRTLQICAWTIGVPATFMNLVVLIRNTRDIWNRNKKTKVNFVVTCLITLIASGDFFVGVYLVGISIENVKKGTSFCHDRNKWITSTACEVYGVISTLGAQLSLFSMTAMSMYRAYIMRILKPTKTATKKEYTAIAIVSFVIITLSLLISLLPMNKYLEDVYFFNGFYLQDVGLFPSPLKTHQFSDVLQKFYGDSKNITNSTSHVKELIKGMFSSPKSESGVHSNINFSELGFYGSSGSCVFKYFVTSLDPQVHYTLTLLGINFACFIIITLSYLSVHFIVKTKSADKTGGCGIQRFGRLQRKISFIILTDCFCWFPLIIMSILHYFEVIDADNLGLYSIFSIFILPINSVINPLLYDSFLCTAVGKLCGRCSSASNKLLTPWFRKSFRNRFLFFIKSDPPKNITPTEEINGSNFNIYTNVTSL